MATAPDLVSLPLTHVYYDPSRLYGLPSAFLALVPLVLLVAYAVAIYDRRELRTCHALSGQLACEGLNFLLKRLIKQQRPQRKQKTPNVIGLGKGYGMPSSHSQFMGYFAAYVAMTLYSGRHTGNKTSRAVRATFAILVSAAVCASRVYLAYHTEKQVYIGSSIGLIFGIVWYTVLEPLRRYGVVDLILDHPVARFFYLKDTTKRNVLEDEWKEWTSGRATRQGRKKR